MVHVNGVHLHWLQPKSRGYKCRSPNGKVIISRNVVSNENLFAFSKHHPPSSSFTNEPETVPSSSAIIPIISPTKTNSNQSPYTNNPHPKQSHTIFQVDNNCFMPTLLWNSNLDLIIHLIPIEYHQNVDTIQTGKN